MKTLALLRHAKSSWDDPALADFDRPLNRRGVKAAAVIGAEMGRRGLAFDLVLASPACRVVETLEQVERGLGESLEPRFDQRVYGAAVASLLDIVRGVDESVGRLLLVGHNPGLHELAVTLAAPGEPLRESLARGYPTAALALLELPVEKWEEVGPGTAQIADFLRPRELSGP
jgi:phosphohistidine phosphatase